MYDTLIWVKISEDALDSDLYQSFSYIPHENNVFSYRSDIRDCSENDISHFISISNGLVAGDFSNRVGCKLDYLDHDIFAKPMLDILDELFEYDIDICMLYRNSEDRVVSTFGRQLNDLCKPTGTIIRNGRV